MAAAPPADDVQKLQIWFKLLPYNPGDLRRILLANEPQLRTFARNSIRAAAGAGALEALRWMEEAGFDCADGGGWAVRAAAKGGHLEVLRWLNHHGLDPAEGLKWATRIAAEKGHLEVLRWLMAKIGSDPFASAGCLVRGAAQGKQLEVLRWLEEMDFPLNEGGPWAVRVAAQVGDVGVVEWLLDHGMDGREHFEAAYRGAAAGGHLSVLRWTAKHEDAPPLHEFACSLVWAACEGGHLHVLEFMHERGVQCSHGGGAAVWVAARGGHLNILHWLDMHGLHPSVGGTTAVQAAIAGGFLNVLVWLVERGATVEDGGNFCRPESAAEAGHLDVLQWLVDREGMPLERLGASLVRGAARGGQLPVLQWLRDREVPIGTVPDAIQEAAARGRRDIVQWLVLQHQANLRDGSHETIQMAAAGGHLGLLTWLSDNGLPIQQHAGAAVVGAAKGGHMEILRWLAKQDCCWRGHNREAVQEAAACGHIEVLVWLQQMGADIKEGGGVAVCRAAVGGHLETLRWLMEHGINLGEHWHAAVWAASEASQPDVHHWLLEGEAGLRMPGLQRKRRRRRSRRSTPRVLSMPLRQAVESPVHSLSATEMQSPSNEKRTENSLKWMLQYTLDPEEDIFDFLQNCAARGHMEVMAWISDVTEPRWAVKFAIQGGHSCALQWLMHSGLNLRSMEEQAVRWAAEAGNVEMLRWFSGMGLRLGSATIDAAWSRGSRVLLDVLRNFQLPLSQHPSLAEELLPVLYRVTPLMLANFILVPSPAAEGALDSALVEAAVSDHKGRPINRAAMRSFLHARTFPHEPDFVELQRTLAPTPLAYSNGAVENVPVKIYRLAVPGVCSPVVLRALAVSTRHQVCSTLAAQAIVVSAWQKVRLIYVMDVLLEMLQLVAFVYITKELKPHLDERTEYEHTICLWDNDDVTINMWICVIVWLKSGLGGLQRIQVHRDRGWGADLCNYREFWQWLCLLLTGAFLALVLLGTTAAVAAPLLSLVGFIRWWMVLYSLRGFNYFGQRILPILGAFREILPFIVVMVFYGGALVHALYALSVKSVWDVFMTTYRLGIIGEMEFNDPVWGTGDSEAPSAWQSLQQIWFIAGAFLFTIALMNIFIAIMSSAFDRKEERAESDFLQTRSSICLGYALSYEGCMRMCWRVRNAILPHRTPPPTFVDEDETVWLCHQDMPRNDLNTARSLRQMIAFATDLLLTETDAKLQVHSQAIHSEMEEWSRLRRSLFGDDLKAGARKNSTTPQSRLLQ